MEPHPPKGRCGSSCFCRTSLQARYVAHAESFDNNGTLLALTFARRRWHRRRPTRVADLLVRRAPRPMTVEEFLRLPTRGPHAELIFGFLRSAVAPLPAQAALIERLRAPLAEHLAGEPRGDERARATSDARSSTSGERRGDRRSARRTARPDDERAGGDAGPRIFVAPLDVVLDDRTGIVLRPPLAVVLAGGRAVPRGRTGGGPTLWGAPDLVVEVLTPATARRMRCSKLRWYRQAGVKECWLLDTRHQKWEVLDLDAGQQVAHVFSGRTPVRSPLLPAFSLEAGRLFRDAPGTRATRRHARDKPRRA